jgi:hypothetical protein
MRFENKRGQNKKKKSIYLFIFSISSKCCVGKIIKILIIGGNQSKNFKNIFLVGHCCIQMMPHSICSFPSLLRARALECWLSSFFLTEFVPIARIARSRELDLRASSSPFLFVEGQ